MKWLHTTLSPREAEKFQQELVKQAKIATDTIHFTLINVYSNGPGF